MMIAESEQTRISWYCRKSDGGCGRLIGHRVMLASGRWGFEPAIQVSSREIPIQHGGSLMLIWVEGKLCVSCPCGRAVEIREERSCNDVV